MYCDYIWVEYGPIVVGQLCDVVLALNLSKDVVHEGHTDAICSALSANHFNVSRMTIYRLMIRLRDMGNTSDRPRSGRPRVTTLRQDRHIRFIHLRNRFVTVVLTARLTPSRTNVRISEQTVRNILHQCGVHVRRPLKGSTLKQCHRAVRMQWGRTRLRWNRNTWQNILLSDESRFCFYTRWWKSMVALTPVHSRTYDSFFGKYALQHFLRNCWIIYFNIREISAYHH
jgi:transposase